jgi:hypothetical protein
MRWAVVAAVAAIGLSAASQELPAAQQKPTEPAKAEQPKPKEQTPAPAAASLQQVEKANASSNASEGDKQQPEKLPWTELTTAIATVAQAIIGALAFGGLVFTVLYARAAWKAAEKSATAADKTLKATREGERRQLRAYVHIHSAHFDPAKSEVTVKFKNFGLTPAHEVTVASSACVRDYPLTEKLTPLVESKSAVLPPGGEPHNVKFPFSEWDDPQGSFGQGGTALYVHGTIKYRDIFKGKRETTFRMFVRSNTTTDMSAAEDGNGAT